MFFSGDYGEFLEPEAELPSFQRNISPERVPNSDYIQSQVLAAQHDMVYSEFTETIGKRLFMQPYPQSFKNVNPFCPLCLKNVKETDIFTTCYINNERNYLIHCQCIEKDKTYQLRHVGQILENNLVVETKIKAQKTFDFGTQPKQYYLQIAFSHPIHDKNFIKINKKTNAVRNQLNISFDQNQTDQFFPNVVVLPLTDYHINVSMLEFGRKGNRAKYSKYISLRNIKEKGSINIQCEQINISAEIIQDSQEQETIFKKMNYKYKFNADEMALLRIGSIGVKLPEDFQESQEEEFIICSSSNIEELLKEKEPSVMSTIKSSSQSPLKPRSDSSHSSQDIGLDSQKVNLDRLIQTGKLIQFVKNNIQSRIFQNYLQECGELQIETVIINIREHLVELIMHQYGNYMVQKLFTVCNVQQRLDILQTIMPSLCDLIRNKQGTHTIQSFITYFTHHEEYSLIVVQLGAEYYDLCRNNNATHFVQKVLKTFPLQYTLAYFSYTVENLLAFALDKNAMCVIKHMIRRFRQLEGQEGVYYQDLELIRRQLITHVTFSVDRLIMDSYGNYVIQFCYELFDLEKCSGITERILSRFAYYAIGKFSSNVILKCIQIYWTDQRIYSSLKGLPNNQIVEVFRNKDGNKILLEIMEKLEGTELWDRLYAVLIRLEPTRFYHDRWGVCLGSRSGQVGGKFLSFPEPKSRNRNRKMKQSIQ